MQKKHIPRSDLGDPDYFQDRHKRKLLRLSNIWPSDVLYDLGCGDAEILILAAQEFGVRKAIGYEIESRRAKKAKMSIEKAKLSDRIIIYTEKMYNADLSNADIIFSMHAEYADDFKKLWNQKIRKGTTLIKHDLPVLGYIPDKVDTPFYRMTFPLKKAKNQNHWASTVLEKKDAKISEVWHELYYYDYEKKYTESDLANEWASYLNYLMGLWTLTKSLWKNKFGEKFNKNYIDLVKAFHLKIKSTEKIEWDKLQTAEFSDAHDDLQHFLYDHFRQFVMVVYRSQITIF